MAPALTRIPPHDGKETIAMIIPQTEHEALDAVMRQTEADLASAHAEICVLQGLEPSTHSWPEWSPQANTLRWFAAIRERFSLSTPPTA